ncbi:hypothetical protein ACE6H2_006175 [Prunus campanulata]
MVMAGYKRGCFSWWLWRICVVDEVSDLGLLQFGFFFFRIGFFNVVIAFGFFMWVRLYL